MSAELISAIVALFGVPTGVGLLALRLLRQWLEAQSEQLATGAKVHVMASSAVGEVGEAVRRAIREEADDVRRAIREELARERDIVEKTVVVARVLPLERRMLEVEARVLEVERVAR